MAIIKHKYTVCLWFRPKFSKFTHLFILCLIQLCHKNTQICKFQIKGTQFSTTRKSLRMSTNTKAVIDLSKKDEDTGSKIDLIKNLIFGENIQAYDSEFEALRKDILDKKKVLEELIEDVRKELHTAIDSVSTDVNIRITELEEKLDDKFEQLDSEKLDKKMLGNLLIELGEKVSKK
mgnify:CR=1 FL=1